MSSYLRNPVDMFRNWRKPKKTVGIVCILAFALYVTGDAIGMDWLTIAGGLVLVVFALLFFEMRRRERRVDPVLAVDPLAFERMGGSPATAGAAASGGRVKAVDDMGLLLLDGPWPINEAADALRLEIERREALLPPGADRDSRNNISMEAARELRQAIESGVTPAMWRARAHADKVPIELGGMYSIENGTGYYTIVKIVACAEDVVNLHFFPGLFSARPVISETGECLGERVTEENERLEIQNVPMSATSFGRSRPQLIGRQPMTVDELNAVRIWRAAQGG